VLVFSFKFIWYAGILPLNEGPTFIYTKMRANEGKMRAKMSIKSQLQQIKIQSVKNN
jgi:hypothetical protein